MNNRVKPQQSLILVTGATGYIGGLLVPRLLSYGYRLRIFTRDAQRLQGRAWYKQVEVVEGDVLDQDSLTAAMRNVEVAYYLIHSMRSQAGYIQRDLQAAHNFGAAAYAGKVARIIYLGGLGDPSAQLAPHLRSRQVTGDALRQEGVPVTEFRAAIVVGSGSISFEMIRYLTERLPVMICPRWVYQRVQPIAIDDVLNYLVASLRVPESTGRIIEIGGSSVLTYGDMMLGYAHARGLRRWLLPVPVLTPRLSSYWVHLVTPVHASVARPLISGMLNEVVVQDLAAQALFPNIQPMDYPSAVLLALANLNARYVETSWRDAQANTPGDILPVKLSSQLGMIIESRQRLISMPPAQVFHVIRHLGGENGWLFWNWTWRLRGWLDLLLGGVGLRRGQRDAEDLRVGDAVDFWRVEAIDPDRRLLLRAEMKIPGSAWLDFQTIPAENRQTRLVQTAYFAPKGLLGLVYWYGLYPIHRIIYAGLFRRIALRAEQDDRRNSMV